MSGRRRAMLGWGLLATLGLVFGISVSAPPSPPAQPVGTDSAAPVMHTEQVRQLPRVVVERGVPAPSGVFSGRVVSAATEEGIPEAEVTLALTSGVVSLMTDAEGRFEFRPPAPGKYQVAAVRAEGFLPFGPEWGRSPIILSAVPGVEVKEVVVELTPAPELVGRVLGPSGEPVSGAIVRLLDGRADQTVLFPALDRFISDERGEFRFSAPEGTRVEARHPAHEVAHAQVGSEALRTRRLEIRMPKADAGPGDKARLSGRVLKPDGSGASRADLSIRTAGSPLPRFYRGVTEEDGSFVVGVLDPGVYHVSASLAGFVPAERWDVRVPMDGLVLQLTEGEALVGRVTEERGAPVPAFIIQVMKHRGAFDQLPFAQSRFIDAEGRYTFRGLTPGRYTLQVVAAGLVPTETQVEVREGAREVRADVVLPRGERLEGRVLSATSREPIFLARVSVESDIDADALSGLFRTRSEPDGTFVLENIPRTGVTLMVSAQGYNRRMLSEIRPPVPLVIELTPVGEASPAIELVGIGITLDPRDATILVGEVIAGGAAQAAGLVTGDEIVRVDGVSVAELGITGTLQRIRGTEGTQVRLSVRKAGQTALTELFITRKKITFSD